VPVRMYDSLFSTPAMTDALSDRNFLRQMLAFEKALALSLEEHKVIPFGTAKALASIDADTLDLETLAKQAPIGGNICIPFVRMLTARVAEVDPTAAAYVHWGATSQDVIDTSLMLQMRVALNLLDQDLDYTCGTLSDLVKAYRHTAMPGRTWLQQGPPVTLGLKLATWLDALLRHQERLAHVMTHTIALQFGGAVGTLATLGNRGSIISHKLGNLLDLEMPAIPWHAQRDRIGELATTLGLLTGTLGKIARDVSLLMQTEVGEFMEPAAAGRGGSSTMPHKRNPVYSAVMLAASTRVPGLVSTILSAMVQEQERGLGGWHAEWETLTEIFRLTAGSLTAAKEIATGASVNSDAMQRNLDLLGGVTMAEAVSFEVARKLGKAEAHRILETVSQRAIRDGISMQAALVQESSLSEHFNPQDFERMLTPINYLGSANDFIENVLSKQKAQTARRQRAED
jgi:3-carboxy-cis,cis-muconate cycloisomerase